MKTKLLLFIFTSLVLVINSKIETALFDLIFIVLYAMHIPKYELHFILKQAPRRSDG